ncbi:MAG TPA: polysaccharide biosynthesis/export family protein [Candidatus Acidoferrales bacterium]|nr:polysaccharide biosynthesis/export family protein [Candidatus Acidoferrales bacterium]
MTTKTIALLSLFLLLCPAITSGIAAQNGAKTSASTIVIGPNDSVTITALDSDEISKQWRVTSTGDLDLPLVGKVHAAGLTSDQLQQELTEKLGKFVRDPEVTVYVSEFRSRPVTVAGGVHRPGTLQLDGPTTLLGLLQMAGGLDAPGPTLIVTREIKYGTIPLPGAQTDADGRHSSIELTIRDVTDPSTEASNLPMQPHDVVSVLTQHRLVYIIGEVNRPGAIELVTQSAVSVMQVLAASGGLTKTAAPGKTEIMRLDPQGIYKRFASIDLKKVMKGKAEDRLLTAGDILVVPTSSVKTYFQSFTAATVGTSPYVILTRF